MLDYPFLQMPFIEALEKSSSVCADTGWEPMHLSAQENECEFFMPLYLKSHSWGEYVFDWSWANAYQEYGLDYYPKLLTAIPFTPATGPRITGLKNGTANAVVCEKLVNNALQLTKELGASGWHLLFPEKTLLENLKELPLLNRTGVQYHWFNRGYQDFDHFLSTLNSRKRKMVRKERADVVRQNIQIDMLEGDCIDADTWGFFYQLYQRTYLKRSGTGGYLNKAFFTQIATTMPEQIVMAIARQENQPIACALYFYDSETLYGRYWGSWGEFQYLHFELCYYRGIELAIAKRLKKFDAGAQGEHKIIRGFEPVETHSLHWIADHRFREAIARFLDDENHSIQAYIRRAAETLPYKKHTNP